MGSEGEAMLLEVLDDMGASFRAADYYRLMKCAFVWEQRRDHLLNGSESWADQRIGPIEMGRYSPPRSTDEQEQG